MINILTLPPHLYKKRGKLVLTRVESLKQKSPIYPLRLGGVWMVGVRGYIGLQKIRKLNRLRISGVF
jgi:hypothetical protein